MEQDTKLPDFPSSFFDRILDARFFLLLLSAVFFIDIILINFYSINTLQITNSFFDNNDLSFDKKTTLGQIIIFIAAFAFLHSLVFPVLRQLLRMLMLHVDFFIERALMLLIKDYSQQGLSPGWVSLGRLLKHACETNNTVEYKLYLDEKRANNEHEQHLNIAFSAMTLTVVDYFVPSQHVKSIAVLSTEFIYSFQYLFSDAIVNKLSLTIWLMLVMGAAIIFYLGAIVALKPPKYGDNYIYYPSSRKWNE